MNRTSSDPVARIAPGVERTLLLPTGLAMTFSCRPLQTEADPLDLAHVPTLDRALEAGVDERK